MKVAAEHSGPKPGLQYAVGDGARRRDDQGVRARQAAQTLHQHVVIEPDSSCQSPYASRPLLPLGEGFDFQIQGPFLFFFSSISFPVLRNLT